MRGSLFALALFSTLAIGSGASAAQLTLVASRDATLFEDNPGYASGAGPGLYQGAIASGSPRRALLRFDLGALPANASIQSVELRFFVSRSASGSGLADPFSVHRLTASWGEGASAASGGAGTQAAPGDATWTWRFSGGPGIPAQPWSAPGGDFVPVASATGTFAGNGTYIVGTTPRLLADIESWLLDPSSNHGWILVGPETGEKKARQIESRESFDLPNRPRLVINYDEAALAQDAPLPLWALALLAAGLGLQVRTRRAT